MSDQVFHFQHPHTSRYTACGGVFATPGYGSMTQNPIQVTCDRCLPIAQGLADPTPVLDPSQVTTWAVQTLQTCFPGWIYPEPDSPRQEHRRLSLVGPVSDGVQIQADLMWGTDQSAAPVGRYQITIRTERI